MPIAGGTNAVLPGISRRAVHLRTVPGGQMQWLRQLSAGSSSGLTGCSSGKDDLELADFTLAKLGAHDAREGADARLFDIGHAEAGWIEFGCLRPSR